MVASVLRRGGRTPWPLGTLSATLPVMAPEGKNDTDTLVLAHHALAKHLARRYARGDRELLEELEQVAALGLVQAAQRFDPTRGTAFSTFAVPTIAGELRRYFRSSRWAVHVPRRLQEAYLAVRDAELEMTAQLGRRPGAAELAERLGWPLDDLLEAMCAGGALSSVSLDAPTDDEDTRAPLSDRIGGHDPGYRACERRDELEQALCELDPIAEEAVRLRYEQQLTYGEVATRIGVSASHAAKVVRCALGDLRATLAAEPA